MPALRKTFLLLPVLALGGCSLKTVALRSTAALLDRGALAFHEEPDPELARQAMGSQLKLLEALLLNAPENEKLLKLCAEGFGGYAFLFLEDGQPDRAKGFYFRGRDYALRALARRKALASLADMNLDDIEKALGAARLEDVPALYWSAFNWAAWINLSKDSPEALAQLPKAVLLMKRAGELDAGYQFGGPGLFFAVYYASRPAVLGGDIKKAKGLFEAARQRTGGRFLMAYVLEARHYAVGVQDPELFRGLLSKVRESPSGALGGARLADEVAKLKAKALLEKVDEYF